MPSLIFGSVSGWSRVDKDLLPDILQSKCGWGQSVPSAVLLRFSKARWRRVAGDNFEFSVAEPKKQVPIINRMTRSWKASNLAWNYVEHTGGNLDIALGLAQRARELNPDNPNIADTLGWIYYKKGLYGSAVALLKESNEKLDNKNPTVLYHLGVAFYRNGDLVMAREALRRSLSLGSTFREAEEAKRVLAEMEAKKAVSAGS